MAALISPTPYHPSWSSLNMLVWVVDPITEPNGDCCSHTPIRPPSRFYSAGLHGPLVMYVRTPDRAANSIFGFVASSLQRWASTPGL